MQRKVTGLGRTAKVLAAKFALPSWIHKQGSSAENVTLRPIKFPQSGGNIAECYRDHALGLHSLRC